jgi:hypothetical protein
MTGNFHDNRIVHTGFPHIRVKGVSEIVEYKATLHKAPVFDAGVFASGRQAAGKCFYELAFIKKHMVIFTG